VRVIARRATQRTVAGVALTLALPVLAGCGLEAKDETSKEHSQIQAAANHIGAMRIRDAFLTTPVADPATSYLVVTLVNDGSKPDTLTGITTPSGTVTLSSGPVTIGPGLVVEISDPAIDPTDSTAVVSTASTSTVGTTVPVTFAFAEAGTTPALQIPVVTPGEGLSPDQVIPTTQATVTTPIA
jgi:copper(I)-binding protein